MRQLKSKILTYFLTLALLAGLMPAWAVTAGAAWDGSSTDIGWYAADPSAADFTINTPEELAGLAVLVNAGSTGTVAYDSSTHLAGSGDASVHGTDFAGKTVTLGADLDLGTGTTWTPIGTKSHPFLGTFDGGNFTVSGSVTAAGGSPEDESGLFGCVGSGAFVKNLNANLTLTYNCGAGTNIGIIAGYNLGTLISCSTAGSVSVSECEYCAFAGGLVGYNDGTILHCSSTADVTAMSNNNYCACGGLAGQCWYDSIVMDCFATGAVTATGSGNQTSVYAGGFIGYNGGAAKDCYCTQGTIATSQTGGSSTTHTGAFAGMNAAPTGILLNAYCNSACTYNAVGYVNGSHVNDVQGLSAAVMTGGDGSVPYHTGYLQTSVYKDPDYTGYTFTADSFAAALNAGSRALFSSNGAVWAADSENKNGGYPVLTDYVYADGLTIQGADGADSIKTEGGTLQLSAAASPANATYSQVGWSVANGDCATLSDTGLLKAKYNGEITVRATALENPAVYTEKTFTVSGLPDSWQEADSVAAAFEGGSGSQSSPYQIKTAGQLAFLAKQVNAGNDYNGDYFVLTADISLAGRQWTPIGWHDGVHNKDILFKGTFDGAGHVVTGLIIGSAASPNTTLIYCGLFGETSGGGISNITVGAQIYSAYDSGVSCAGILAGYMDGTAVSDCHTSGNVTASGPVGAYNSNAYGGLAGHAKDGIISYCSADVKVTDASASRSTVGGLIGSFENSASGSISICHSTGAVSSAGDYSRVGGLVGDLTGPADGCYATGSVTATGDNSYAGGFTGSLDGVTRNCYAEGNASAGDNAYAGGFTGYSMKTILNCYAAGNAQVGAASGGAAAYAGGFVGYNIFMASDNNFTGTIENCYAAGTASGGTGATVGGFAGFNGKFAESSTTYGTLLNDYYDATKNTGGVGHDDASDSHVSGLTTAEMTGSSAGIDYYTSYTDSSTNAPAAAATLVNALNGGCALCGDVSGFSAWMAGGDGYPVFLKTWTDFAEDFAGGSGTCDDPYRIATAGQLANLAKLVNAGTGSYRTAAYVLTADINLSGRQWTPISEFDGVFNGNGHTVKGLTIGSADASDSALRFCGLFATLNTNAFVETVGVTGAAIYSAYPRAYIGVLAGGNGGTIRDSYTSGVVVTTARALAGGIAGVNYGEVDNSYSGCSVTSSGERSFTGGITGGNSGTIENCYSSGSVSATGTSSCFGGFVGKNRDILKNDYYNSTLNVGGGIGTDEGTGTLVTGLTTDVMKGASGTITYYTDDSDTTGTAAGSLVDALNGGIKLLGRDYAYKTWQAGGSANGGYPVFYTPSSSSGFSSGGSAVVTATAGDTTTATTDITAAAGRNGTAAASVTDAQISAAAAKAAAEARSQGSGRTVVEFRISAPGSAAGVETTLPQASLNSIAAGGTGALTLTTPVAGITFDSTALGSISGQASDSVTVTARRTDTSALSDAQRKAVGSRPVYTFSVTCGATTISSFGGGTATIRIPYTPSAGEDTHKIVVYFLSDSGELVMVPDCVYDASTGTVTFTTTHFSNYAVGYHDVSFSDVSDSAWYKDCVSYLAARNIVGGTGNGKFSPDANITRAQFVTILAGMSGKDLSGYTASAFSDVSRTNWYFAAAQWANEAGVAVGSDGKFDPNAKITREQMTVMLYRYAKYMGADVSNAEGMSVREFNDYAGISNYALLSIQWALNNSIVSGNADGSFAPQKNATRAQAAMMIAIFLQKMVK